MNASLPADIFEAMHELLHLFRSRMREDMESMEPGLTPNEVRVLMHVGRHPGRTQRDLVDHSHMDKAQLARMLAQLQEQGWLDREPDARDRRVRCLSLSPQGQALFDRLRQSRQALAARLLKDWEPAAQQQLMALLERARDSVEAAP
ncbi:MarR family winged helix-turn-helix transcriptional regulator [Delftia acidovorans]|uniref:MarR family winged helix-turn-helix transcriptional regulator n=1 Tax=Delftia acidovorans TaxID=80866 RepID=UPI001EDF133F|nr:MarR family transcriptional regulator [Delftia acidovorans]MCG3781122.1 MarR family transcriptional regulator [Delftia acidovorans]